MNPRNTGLLLLIALALGGYLYLTEIAGEEDRLEAEAKKKQLFPELSAEDIDWIVLQTSEGEARLERREQTWRLVSPVDFPADAIAADGLATNLADLSQEAQLEDPGPVSEYGLDAAARVVRFGSGERDVSVRFGRETPIGSNTYAKLDDDEAIVTMPTFRANSFTKGLLDLRDKRILDFDMGAVERLEARWPGGRVEVEKRSPEGEAGELEWHLTAPVEGRADFEAVRDLLATLSFLRAEGFVDAPGEAALASFEAPAYEVTLHLGAGDGGEGAEARTLTLALGGVYEGDQRLVRGAERSLYTIAAERMAEFPRRVVEFRFRRLAEFEINDARQLDLYFQPAVGDPVAVSATRGDEGWSSSPEKTAPGKLARLVSELSKLDAGDILAEDASELDLGKLELAPPNAIVTVLGESPEGAEGDAEVASVPRLAEIHLGRIEGSEWIVARAMGDPTVYRLEYELAEHVPVSLDAFRSRFLAEEDEPAAPDLEGEDLSPSEESP
jgi:hypothetical protein